MARKNSTKHVLKQEFLKIAFPAILENAVVVLITSIDTKMISPLSHTALSAVALTTQPKLLFFSLFYALGTTASFFISHAKGKNDKGEANRYFHMILKITILLSVVTGGVTAFFAEQVMDFFSRQQETVSISATFFRIIMIGLLFQAVSIILNASLRGMGNTKVTLYASIAMGAVDILVNYLLIEGHWGCPRLEVRGDAIATVAGTIAACFVGMYFLAKKDSFLTFRGFFKKTAERKAALKEIKSKAVNTILENIFTRIGFLLSAVIVSSLSSSQTAVYFVTMILLNYTFVLGDGLQTAVSSLTGQSMGANKPAKIKWIAGYGKKLGFFTALGLSALYILTSRYFFGFFFSDAASIHLGSQYAYFAAALTILQIMRFVNVGILRGAGDVKTPRNMAIICVLIINPLTAFLLTDIFHFGVWGIWIASVAAQSVWFVMSMIRQFAIQKSLRKSKNGGEAWIEH